MSDQPLAALLARLFAGADAIDDRRGGGVRQSAPSSAWPGPLVNAWSAAELLALIGVLPVAAALVAERSRRATTAIHERVATWPAELADVARADTRRLRSGVHPRRNRRWRVVSDGALGSVARRPADVDVVITSDLHRSPRGLMDVPGAQGVTAIYEAMLDHYATGAWVLVENGDVEDFWVLGGSTYGVAYQWARLVASGTSRSRVYGEHLARTVANNEGIYARIQDAFHAPGRYVRLLGNHDDVYADPAVVDALGSVHPGVEVHEYLALDDPAAPPGADALAVVTHGHQLDAWNAPDQSGLGRFGTWLGCTLRDAPWLDVSPGVPTLAETEQLLDGGPANALTRVSRTFGADRDLYSLDEVLVHEAVRRRWRDGSSPWLVLGHTHLPLRSPDDAGGGGAWSRYCNAGSGVFAGAVTAIEWPGSAGSDAQPVLVAWHPWRDGRDEGLVSAEHEGRRYARTVLLPPPGDRPRPPR